MLRIFITLAGVVALAAAHPAGAQQAAAVQQPVSDGSTVSDRASAYRINAGDEIEVYVWGEERLQRNVKVLPDGTFAFPLVGQIVAQGLLPAEIEALITAGLSDQYRGEVPQVTVSVVSPMGLQFSVVGKVNSPGTFTPGRYVNILEALSFAGGPSEFAKLNDVVIIRKSGDQLTTLSVRLAPLFKTGADIDDLNRANITRIMTGDTVIVP